jgi:hypothetical protein
MKRLLVFAVVAALSVAGGTGPAFGQNGGPRPPSKSQAPKPRPPAAPGKRPPGKAPPGGKKAPPPAQKKAPAKRAKGEGCFGLFNTGNEAVNAYLMMVASHYAYAPALGMADRNNDTFQKKFEDTFRRFGMKEFRLIANSSTEPLPSTKKGWAVRAMVFSNDRVVVVSFRGSELDLSHAPADTWRNWVGTNLQTHLRAEKSLGPGVEVHDGFWTALDSVYKGLAAEIGRQGGFKPKKVFVTGHSLGGALATLCALRLQKDGHGSAAVYTYGSPRVGNDKFQAAFRLQHHRWVNDNDLVTAVPPDLLGYRPVGTLDHIMPGGTIRLNDRDGTTPPDAVVTFLDAVGGPVLGGAAEVGTALANHGPPLYSRALYNNLPSNLKGKMPDPPTK